MGDGFAVSFSDISARKETELAVVQNAQRLQRILDNVVAFVGILTPEGILKEVNQPALDVAGLKREEVVNKPFWEAYWWSLNKETQDRLRRAIDDANAGLASRYDVEIRIAENKSIWIDFQLNPLVNEDGSIDELIPSGVDITERKQSETHRDLLVGELNHRVKNSLATIQAMARQTIRSSEDMKGFEKTFTARLDAISAAHEILMGEDQGRASLMTMIERQIGPYTNDIEKQLRLSGAEIMLSGPSAHAIGLVLHELATNAAKYGALSAQGAFIDISWSETDDGFVNLEWKEKNGPAVSTPKRKGFGTRLIKQSLEYSLGGKAELNYLESGFTANLSLPKEPYDD